MMPGVADSGMAPACASEQNVKIVTIAVDTIELFISCSDVTIQFNLPKRNHQQLPIRCSFFRPKGEKSGRKDLNLRPPGPKSGPCECVLRAVRLGFAA
jgi:hypothetical protein